MLGNTYTHTHGVCVCMHVFIYIKVYEKCNVIRCMGKACVIAFTFARNLVVK